jgi:hypothetical protein
MSVVCSRGGRTHEPDPWAGEEVLYQRQRRPKSCGRLEVVAAAADSASHPSHEHQYCADDEQDDADDPQDVDFEHESGDKKDDSEDDHGVYLISVRMEGTG